MKTLSPILELSALALTVQRKLATIFIALCIFAVRAHAQTTAFTFQGKLNDNGLAANGSYDLQLKLYDLAAVGSGTQVGTTITLSAVPVTDGVFTVQPDFTAASFPGADRFVEVGVRVAGSGSAFTILSPRQAITPTPYAMHSLSAVTANSATNATNATNASNATTATTATNATQLGGTAASQYVQTNDSRLSDARAPLAGSTSYVQNTTTQEAGSLNLSLNGTFGGTLSANAVNSVTQYNLGGSRVLGGSAAAENTYAGILAGNVNTGGSNAFFGSQAGASNTTGGNNAFLGSRAGFLNVSGGNDAAIGTFAGYHNNSGSDNTYVGYDAGDSNTTGSSNTLIGSSSNVGAGNLTNATAIGAAAVVSQSNSVVLGNNASVGIGTSVPTTRLTVNGGTPWTSNGWTGSMNLQNGSALGWEANASGQRFGIGHSGGGLYFFRTNSAFGNNASPASYDMVITDTGTTQVKVLQITGGSDLAEHFEIDGDAKSGTIVAIDPLRTGKLVVARGGYNRRVVGVISGANNLAAGMVLPDVKQAGENSLPIALSGRVWVYANASKGTPIRPGDLLTTSAKVPGYAMKVTNYGKAQGAIIGKAMTSLDDGNGMVLALVSLQ